MTVFFGISAYLLLHQQRNHICQGLPSRLLDLLMSSRKPFQIGVFARSSPGVRFLNNIDAAEGQNSNTYRSLVA